LACVATRLSASSRVAAYTVTLCAEAVNEARVRVKMATIFLIYSMGIFLSFTGFEYIIVAIPAILSSTSGINYQKQLLILFK